uniref:Uncharacterized protein n=1 Tax=viral metagenome TaxID=1070528 RepID=A0A6C0E0F8_9ZZZZ
MLPQYSYNKDDNYIFCRTIIKYFCVDIFTYYFTSK